MRLGAESPCEGDAVADQSGQLWTDNVQFVSIDDVEDGSGEQSGCGAACISCREAGNRENRECSAESGQQLQSGGSDGAFREFHADLGEPRDIDHADPGGEWQQGFGDGIGLSLQKVFAVVEVIPEIGMPESAGGERPECEAAGGDENGGPCVRGQWLCGSGRGGGICGDCCGASGRGRVRGVAGGAGRGGWWSEGGGHESTSGVKRSRDALECTVGNGC